MESYGHRMWPLLLLSTGDLAYIYEFAITILTVWQIQILIIRNQDEVWKTITESYNQLQTSVSHLGPYDTNSVTEAITSQPKPHTFYEVENDQQHTSYENITSEKQSIPKLIETSMPQKKLPKVSKTLEPRKKLFENINDLTNYLLSSYSTKESFINDNNNLKRKHADIKLYQTFRKLFAKNTKFYKAGKNERIQDFAGRIEKIYHELTYALTIGRNATDSKIIAKTIQGQASSVFMSGVHPAINTILEARAVTTFDLAVVIAMEKERNFEDRKSGYDKNKNKNNKNKIKCNRCNKMGHYANECYSKVTASSGFRNPTYNDIKKENTGQVKFCKYCRKTNHDINDCRKRIFNENKKKQEGGYTPSNETNRTAGEIQNNVRVIKQMNEEHITCESNNFEPRNINFLIDSGADMNLIKITAVEKNVVVNEQDK
ncbi:hypothetical protein QTP88_011341 [Uroleucon formosanum]